jgi:hypothetical protein
MRGDIRAIERQAFPVCIGGACKVAFLLQVDILPIEDRSILSARVRSDQDRSVEPDEKSGQATATPYWLVNLKSIFAASSVLISRRGRANSGLRSSELRTLMKKMWMKLFFATSCITLCSGVASAQGTIVYQNTTTQVGAFLFNGAATIGTDLAANIDINELTLASGSAGASITSLSFIAFNFNAAAVVARPVIYIWATDGAGGNPGTLLGKFVLADQTLAVGTNTISFTVPGGPIIPSNMQIWAGIGFDNDNGASPITAAQLNALGGLTYHPATVGTDGPNALFIPPGSALTNPAVNPFGATFGANYGWTVTAEPLFLTRYAANLNVGESYIDITNTGANGASLQGPGLGAASGNICVNVYAFDSAEELVSCCSCLVTPDQTVNLGVNADLTAKTLTGVVPTSVTIKLVATLAGAGGSGTGTVCNNSAAGITGLAQVVPGVGAWGTTLHQTPTAGTYATTETPFPSAALSSAELASISGRCASIVGNASGFGICTSCRSGALGGQKL